MGLGLLRSTGHVNTTGNVSWEAHVLRLAVALLDIGSTAGGICTALTCCVALALCQNKDFRNGTAASFCKIWERRKDRDRERHAERETERCAALGLAGMCHERLQV